jgi:hypothetical protein
MYSAGKKYRISDKVTRLVDTEKQPDEARNGACVAIRDQDIAG